eukprot:symbB.v1.2.026429.t1/scaffold2637.1/size74321/5
MGSSPENQQNLSETKRATMMAWIIGIAALSPALADWVAISGEPRASVHEMELERSDQEEWVPVGGHTLWPNKGYNPEVIGNLHGAQEVPQNFAARNFALVMPLSAGTPKQDFSLLLDTEGSDIWLPSIRCDTCAADQKEQESFYRAPKSKTFKPHLVPTPFGLAPQAVGANEGGGHVGGYVINDTISIGSLEVNQIGCQAVMADMAPSKPAKGGALSTAGYYDPARIEVMLKSQLAELYGIIANYNRKTMDFCMHHYETCKQAEMENHELRTRLAVVRDSISAKGQKGDPLQSLMSRQHVQATKLLVKKDCEARSATAENAVLRDQLVQTTRIVHQLEEERRAATADSPHVMSLEEADVSPTTPGKGYNISFQSVCFQECLLHAGFTRRPRSRDQASWSSL